MTSIVRPNVINAEGQSEVGSRPEGNVQVAANLPELGETLRVVNIGVETVRFAWNSRQYVIHPGNSEYMPFDAVKVYVGDPRSTNIVRTLKDSIGIISFLPDRAT